MTLRLPPRLLIPAILLAIVGTLNAQDTDSIAVGTASTVVHRDLAYVPNGHERQRLDLYLPAITSPPAPLIVVIHGGGWQQGDKARSQGIVRRFPLLLRRGYAIASLNYRYSNQALFPAQVHDVKAAVRWLRENAAEYGLNEQRFGVWGQSSGAHLAAMLGTTCGVPEMDVNSTSSAQSACVQAVADWFGPTDFLQMDANRLVDGFIHDVPTSPESQLVGGPIQSMKNAVQAANPITYVSKDDAPFQIVHGDSDRLVPHHQSELLHAALRSAGVAVEFHTVPGGGHGSPESVFAPLDELLIDFFDRHLRVPPPRQ
jgi:acetyl esterase/lipase